MLRPLPPKRIAYAVAAYHPAHCNKSRNLCVHLSFCRKLRPALQRLANYLPTPLRKQYQSQQLSIPSPIQYLEPTLTK